MCGSILAKSALRCLPTTNCPLAGNPGVILMSMKRYVGIAAVFCIYLCGRIATAEQHALSIPNVRSGAAKLRQHGRLTILEIVSPPRSTLRVPLTHPSDYRQGTNAPYEAHIVAESPNHFLIFTDAFASNPGNIQGHCGASPTGERYVHVVSLEAPQHESLSVLIDSCLLDIEPSAQNPEWIARPDSAGFVGSLKLSFESGTQPTSIFYIAPDGSVSRPKTELNRSSSQ
jgi:hypothetical protein